MVREKIIDQYFDVFIQHADFSEEMQSNRYTIRYMTIPVQKSNDVTNCGVYVLEFARLFIANRLVRINSQTGRSELIEESANNIDIKTARKNWSKLIYGS